MKFRNKKRDNIVPQIFDAAAERDMVEEDNCEFLSEISKEDALCAANKQPDETGAVEADNDTAPDKEEDETEEKETEPATAVNIQTSPESEGDNKENENSASEEAEHGRVEAEDAGARIVGTAHNEAKSIINEAHQEAIKITTEAELKRDKVIREAELQAEEIIKAETAKANEDADKIIEAAKLEANEKAGKIIEAAKLKANEEARRIIEESISKEFESRSATEARLRVDMDAEYKSLSAMTLANKKEINSGISEIARELNNVEAALIKMQEVKNEIYAKMFNWEKELYKTEYLSLAQCFDNLVNIVDVFEKRLAKELSYGDEGYHADLAKELARLANQMKTFKNNLERAMALLGIKAYFPEIGSDYNEIYHICNDGDYEMSGSYNGKAITKCIKPGLSYKAGDNEIILVKATVEIKL